MVPNFDKFSRFTAVNTLCHRKFHFYFVSLFFPSSAYMILVLLTQLVLTFSRVMSALPAPKDLWEILPLG